MFLSSYRNTSKSLGEWEMLWEHEPQASVSTPFWVLQNFHQKKENNLLTLNIKM